MSLSKRLTYKEVVGRIDDALDSEFYLEASWISYSLFEDRCNSILEKTGGMPPLDGQPFISINKKLKTLKHRANIHPFLISINNFSTIIDEINDWKERRNPIMHRMVEMPRTWESINGEAKVMAIDGRELLAKFLSIAMEVRRKYKKQGN